MGPINAHTQMDHLTPHEQARKAIAHVLRRVRDDSRVGHYLGPGSQSFDLLTEALASLDADSLAVIRAAYAPKTSTVAPGNDVQGFDLVAHLHRQRAFSERTFGPGARTDGVIDHIRKELVEITDNPTDLMEWVDVILLALDGAWRAGWTPEEIARAIAAKQGRNESRTWPDWRTVPAGKAIEHNRDKADAPR